MKRIVVAITGENTEVRLIFSVSYNRNPVAYLPSMGIDLDSEEAKKYVGVLSSYYLFNVSSFEEVKDFVEAEKARIKAVPLKDRNRVFLAQLKDLSSFFAKKKPYETDRSCKDYLSSIFKKVENKYAEILEMKFDFI